MMATYLVTPPADEPVPPPPVPAPEAVDTATAAALLDSIKCASSKPLRKVSRPSGDLLSPTVKNLYVKDAIVEEQRLRRNSALMAQLHTANPPPYPYSEEDLKEAAAALASSVPSTSHADRPVSPAPFLDDIQKPLTKVVLNPVRPPSDGLSPSLAMMEELTKKGAKVQLRKVSKDQREEGGLSEGVKICFREAKEEEEDSMKRNEVLMKQLRKMSAGAEAAVAAAENQHPPAKRASINKLKSQLEEDGDKKE